MWCTHSQWPGIWRRAIQRWGVLWHCEGICSWCPGRVGWSPVRSQADRQSPDSPTEAELESEPRGSPEPPLRKYCQREYTLWVMGLDNNWSNVKKTLAAIGVSSRNTFHCVAIFIVLLLGRRLNCAILAHIGGIKQGFKMNQNQGLINLD